MAFPFTARATRVRSPARSRSSFRRAQDASGVGLDPEPSAVGRHVPGGRRAPREEEIARGDHMLGAVLPPAARGQSPALVPVVVDGKHGHRLSDDEGLPGQAALVFQHLPERPELLAASASIEDLLNQASHGRSLSCRTPFFGTRPLHGPSREERAHGAGMRHAPCPSCAGSRSSSSRACIRWSTTSMAS